MKNRKGFTLIELMIVIAIIGILAAMAVPNFKKARQSAREKACYSNIRVIQGAVEMYNMDNSTMLSSISSDEGQSLVTGGYLKNVPVHPESTCKYAGDNLDKDGYVYCTLHGDLEGNQPDKSQNAGKTN